MGSRLKRTDDLQLKGQAPLAARWKLYRNGKLLSETDGRAFDARVDEPGNYRVELWLPLAGEDRVWILSNPLYVTAD
jgi:hypothetical protein